MISNNLLKTFNYRKLRLLFVDDEPEATIKIKETDSRPTNIKIVSETSSGTNPQDLTIKINQNSYGNDEMDDMSRLRLALARTKILGKYSHDLPVINGKEVMIFVVMRCVTEIVRRLMSG